MTEVEPSKENNETSVVAQEGATEQTAGVEGVATIEGAVPENDVVVNEQEGAGEVQEV